MPPSLRTDADPAAQAGSVAPAERLYVAWQEPESRAIRPVGVLTSTRADDASCYEFRYLRGAQRRPFQPFVGFPDLHAVYRSPDLFPMFENRLMPSGRDDYLEYLGSLGLPAGAAPFEVLAASFGRRATDRVEVFAEPAIDPRTGLATCLFLARGIRHLPGAPEAVAILSPGDRLLLQPEPDNRVDPDALQLIAPGGAAIGYVPAYLTGFLRHVADHHGSYQAVTVLVDRVNPRAHTHLRLLCQLRSPMPPGGFTHSDLAPIVDDAA